MPRSFSSFVWIVTFSLSLFAWVLAPQLSQGADDTPQWISLFDGETLGHWERVETGGSGAIKFRNGAMRITQGVMGSGVRYAAPEDQPFPTENYEIEYTAQRSMGSDFFAAMTFPVGDSSCTFINGGWGGALVGLSSIDGYDASENKTSSFYGFRDKTWYIFRIRVTKRLIQVWLDDDEIIKAYLDGKEVSVRMEMRPFCPLGIATWVTEGMVKNIVYRHLTQEEIDEINADADREAMESAAPMKLPVEQIQQ